MQSECLLCGPTWLRHDHKVTVLKYPKSEAAVRQLLSEFVNECDHVFTAYYIIPVKHLGIASSLPDLTTAIWHVRYSVQPSFEASPCICVEQNMHMLKSSTSTLMRHDTWAQHLPIAKGSILLTGVAYCNRMHHAIMSIASQQDLCWNNRQNLTLAEIGVSVMWHA